MATYRAIFTETGEVIYSGRPRGNLIGELPAGARPKPDGEAGTLDRSDGGDQFERAVFATSSGRTIVIERERER